MFAPLGHDQQPSLDECAPDCPNSRQDDYDAMRRNYLIADISLGVALASAGIATWTLISDGEPSLANDERSGSHHDTHLSPDLLVSRPGLSLQVNTGAF